MMNKEEIAEHFCKIVEEHPDLSVGLAAIKTLMKIIGEYKCATVQDLREKMRESIDVMENSNSPVAAIKSGCELFIRFITLCELDTRSIEQCKQNMLGRGKLFLEKLEQSREKIARITAQYIDDGSKILVHSRSRVVRDTLREAVKNNIRIEVFVTVSQPDNSGEQMFKELQAENIPCTLILDSAMGYVMEQIDFVMVGAEAVCESGGIVNKLGTYTLAICAKELNKPFYVVSESFKFSRVFPLNQKYLPEEYKYSSEVRKGGSLGKQHPLVDYTPPEYITLLFTDLGILTPAAVSDEVIKLYL